MSTQKTQIENESDFLWNSQCKKVDFVFVDYIIESYFDIEATALSMAQEQSLTARGIDVLKRDVDLSHAAARVFKTNILAESRDNILPFYMLSEALERPSPNHSGSFQRALLTLAYPCTNLGRSMTDLWNTVFGELPRHGILNSIRVTDIRMPEKVLERYSGPKHGVSGLRELTSISDRPLFCRSMQPAVGLTTSQMLEINEQVLRGGFDIVKDDELSFDTEYSQRPERWEAHMKLVKRLSEQSGVKKSFFANLIASPLTSLELLTEAERIGVDGLLVAPGLQGFEFISDIRKRSGRPILAHNAGDDCLTRHPKLGVHPALLIKLYRLMGADLVMLPGDSTTQWQNLEDLKLCIEACFGELGGARSVMPILAGGKTSDQLSYYAEAIGSPDFMIIAATALNENPDGLEAGARAFIERWETS